MRRWLVVVLALGVAACDAVGESSVRRIGSELADLTVRELGDLATRVARNPGVADSILSADGIDISELDAIVAEMGAHAEEIGAALEEIPVGELGALASRITKDRSVADSLLAAHGIEAGRLDEVLDRIGPDAEALAAYLASLAGERKR